MCGDGVDFLHIVSYKLLYILNFVGGVIGHVVHIIIHFVEVVRGDAGNWPGWLGSNSGGVGATKWIGASTGLDLTLQAFMRLDKCVFSQ